jgi:hypothetical protein
MVVQLNLLIGDEMRYLFFLLLFSFSFSECDDFNMLQCSSNTDCEWVEDVEIIYCNTLSTSGWGPGVCEYYYPDCYNYLDYGGSYGSWTTECGGGTTQIDNSYCQENPNPPSCDEMIEFQCISDQGCDWIEDIEYGNCSNYNNSGSCNSANTNCEWGMCYGGSYGDWSMCCRGGTFETDDSYCEENNYIQGDLNGDMILNILDILLIIDIILNQESNDLADINGDSIVNILDVIELVDIIINT